MIETHVFFFYHTRSGSLIPNSRYFTLSALGHKPALIEQFWAIKSAAADALVKAGGSMTHHHAIGRDHRRWYDQERPELFAVALRAVKSALDPKWLLNPGVLIDP